MDTVPVPSPLHRKYAATRRLRKMIWRHLSGKMGAVHELNQNYNQLGVESSWWQPRDRRKYLEPIAVVESLAGHVEPGNCAGNGRTCACRLLKLMLAGLSAQRSEGARRVAAVLQIVYGVFTGIVLLYYGFDLLGDAIAVTSQTGSRSEHLFNIYSGLSTGLLVGAMVVVLTTGQLAAQHGAEYLWWIGDHPDIHGKSWYARIRLFGLLWPAQRRLLRTGRLRRVIRALSARAVRDMTVLSSKPVHPETAALPHRAASGSVVLPVLALTAGIVLVRRLWSRRG